LTGTTAAQDALAKRQAELRNMIGQPPPGFEPPKAAAAPGAGGEAAAASEEAVKADKERIELAQKIAKIERDAGSARRSDTDKLAALQRELMTLREQDATLEGGTTENLQNQVAQAEKRAEIEKQQTKINEDQRKEQERIADIRDKMNQQAEDDLAASQEATKEMQLQTRGRKDLADCAKIEFDYDKQITAARRDITKAEELGLTEVANTNRALVTQLSLEKQTALAAHDKAVAEENAKKAAAAAADVAQEKEKLAAIHEEIVLQNLKLAGQTQAAQLLQIE